MKLKDNDILKYLSDNEKLKSLSFDKLDQWIEEHPYSYLLHFIKAKKYKIEGREIPKDVLQMVATYSNDRRRMKEMLEDGAKVIDDKERRTDDGGDEIDEVRQMKDDVGDEIDDASKMLEDKGGMKGDMIKKEKNKKPKSKEKVIKKKKRIKPKKVKDVLQDDISSFTAWLKSMDAKKDVEAKSKKKKEKKGTKNKKKVSRLDKMLQKSLHIKEGIVSETYADLLLNQGHTERAIEMYKALMMKYPQKSNIFASKLEKIEKK